MTIPTELKRAAEQAGDQPLRLEDPETSRCYVLVTEEVFERMLSHLEAESIDPSFFEVDDFEPAREDPR